MGREIFNQRGAIGLAAFRIAQCIQLQRTAVTNTKLVQNGRTTDNNLNIAFRLGDTKQFHPELMELTLTAFLRAFMPEHWTGIEIFQRNFLLQAVRDIGTGNTRSIFRPQGHAVAVPHGEGIHLLGDHVRGFTQRPAEHFGKLENRRYNFLIAVKT